MHEAELDVADAVSFGLEEVNELLGELIEELGVRRKRDAEIVASRLGVSGERPQTPARIGARFDLARDRVRQLHTRAVGQILRDAAVGGHKAGKVFARRYPLDARDSESVRALLVETYATDTDLAANEWAYLKLRIAGHAPEDAKRVAGYVMQRIMAWQKKTRHRLAKLHQVSTPGAAIPLFEQVEWPSAGAAAALPGKSARVVDGDDESRARFYLDKVGREVAFDSALEASLLHALTASELVDTFQETPCAVEYLVDGERRIAHPSAVARLTDGRVVLIDVQPLGHLGFHLRRRAAVAGREFAHANGWGWMVWTGSRTGVDDLVRRAVDPEFESRLVDLLASGPVFWSSVRTLADEVDATLLDLIALTLRHDWRWDRAPFTLRRR
ncbi:hypothetical protein ACWEKT_26040 [Nocardia takedensis]